MQYRLPMPVLPDSTYTARFPFTNGHIQTIYPTLFRGRPELRPSIERIDTPDNDFIDLDWHYSTIGPAKKVCVISHGLEGHSRKKYPMGLADILTRSGWDAVCLNFRGCSGEPNRTFRLYHSGVTDDLHTVLTHVLAIGKYEKAALAGFSMGGNQTLKYLGEDPDKVPEQVSSAVVFSVPCDLVGAGRVMKAPSCAIYMRYFMHTLREKVRIKDQQFPGRLDLTGLESIRTFDVFDDRFTSVMHGFKDAHDYYVRSSSLQFLKDIRVPTLMVNAKNDPFLSPSCYPEREADENPNLFLEMPKTGGHVGFIRMAKAGPYWSDLRTMEFLEQA